MKTFEQYAEAGASHDVMDALRLLTDAYVKECGISLCNRTIVHDAAEMWQEKLAWLDLPLSEMAAREWLVTLMPMLSDNYTHECDRYDITYMNRDELLEGCKEIVNNREFDEATSEVLCYGIRERLTKQKFEPFEVTTKGHDGQLLKGRCVGQGLAVTRVEMTEPFNDVVAMRYELVRDPGELLYDAYIDYIHLDLCENEVRQLYEIYKEEYMKCKDRSGIVKSHIFNDVFEPLFEYSVLFHPERLLTKMYGMEFYDINTRTEPSWYKGEQ